MGGWLSTRSASEKSEAATRAALERLDKSRALLERRLAVVTRNRLAEASKARELTERRNARATHQFTDTEQLRVRAAVTRLRIVYGPSMRRLHAMITNIDAVSIQLQDSFVMNEAVDALRGAAATQRRHHAALAPAEVERIMDELTEQQERLEAVQLTLDDFTRQANAVDDDELEAELAAIDAERLVDESALEAVRADERAREAAMVDAMQSLATTDALMSEVVYPRQRLVGDRQPLLAQ